MLRALLLVLLVCCLVACGRSPDGGEAASEPSGAEPTAKPGEEKADPAKTPAPEPAAAAKKAVAQAAPAAAAPTVEQVGDLVEVDLAALEKRVVDHGANLTVVAAWATWCAPCIEEMPTLASFYKKHKDSGLSVVGLCMDDRTEMKDKIQEVLDRIKVPFPNVLIKEGGQDAFMAAVDKEWAGSLPATLVYDKTGKRVAFFKEALTHEILDNKVAPLLGK